MTPGYACIDACCCFCLLAPRKLVYHSRPAAFSAATSCGVAYIGIAASSSCRLNTTNRRFLRRFLPIVLLTSSAFRESIQGQNADTRMEESGVSSCRCAAGLRWNGCAAHFLPMGTGLLLLHSIASISRGLIRCRPLLARCSRDMLDLTGCCPGLLARNRFCGCRRYLRPPLLRCVLPPLLLCPGYTATVRG